MKQAEVPEQAHMEAERLAATRAEERARIGRWDLNIAVFLFGVLIIVMILLFQGIGVEIVAPIAVVGLALVWLAGWWQGKRLYQRFYNEELFKLEQGSKKMEETIEEKVQKALHERSR